MLNFDNPHYYDILEVGNHVTRKEITASYSRLVKEYNPDGKSFQSPSLKQQAHEKFELINEAYQTLRNPIKRAEYDAFLDEFICKEVVDVDSEAKEEYCDDDEINKIVINCPKCNQRLRVVSGRTLIVTCVSCHHDFEYPSRCEESQSEVVDEKPFADEQKDTVAKEECSAEEEPKEESQSEEDVNKIVINCPKCNQRLRVVSGRTLIVTCVSCNHDFEYPFGCEESQSEVVDEKPLNNEQAAQIPKRVSQNYFCKHWRGELSLAISFWVNIFLINIALLFLNYWLALSSPINHPVISARVTIIIVIIRLLIFAWQIVGLWRACVRHVATNGRAFWARTAQAIVVLGLIAFLGSISAYWGAYKALYQVGFQGDATYAYTLTLRNNDSIIHLEGGLKFGASKDVAALLKDHPDAKGIILDCVGGRVFEGRELSKLILVYGLDTYSLKGCNSAGTIAFISGTNRFLGTGATLGFHHYQADYNLAEFIDLNKEQEEDLRIFKRKGIKKEFLEKLYTASSEDLWFPSRDELLSAGVIHGVVNPSDLTPLERMEDIDVREEFLNIPVYKTIQKYEPKVFEQIITDINEQYKNGSTLNKLQETGAKHLMVLANRLLPMSSNETLIRFVQLISDTLKKLVVIDPLLCLKWLYPEQFGTLDIYKYLSYEVLESFDAVTSIVISDAYEKEIPLVDLETVEPQIQKIALQLGEDALYIVVGHEKLQNSDQYKRYCDAQINFFELILAEDKEIAANVLRHLFSQAAADSSATVDNASDDGNYDGDIVDGKMHGYGTYILDGDKYVGEFKNDKIDGQGTLTWSNGDKYVGEWKDNVRHGSGTLTYSDGREYVGEFKNGNIEGQGKHTWPEGDKYVGEWKDNVRHGSGTNTLPDGEMYVGGWKDDKQHGQGTITWLDGGKFVGKFKDNNVVDGWYYLADGSRKWVYTDAQGNWKYKDEADRKIKVDNKSESDNLDPEEKEINNTVSPTQEDVGNLNTMSQDKNTDQITPDMHFVLQKLGEPSSKERDPNVERWNYGTSYVEFKEGVFFRCYEPHGMGDLHRKLNLK